LKSIVGGWANSHEEYVKYFSQKTAFVGERQLSRLTYGPHDTLLSVNIFTVENVLERLIDDPPCGIIIVSFSPVVFDLLALDLRLDLTNPIEFDVSLQSELRLQLTLVVR